jgi:alkylation response protein AidB-like acyl-CoA dehydrogenase
MPIELSTVFHLPPEQQQWLESAERLAPVFAERARRYDDENAPQAEDFADLHAAGLLAATVPKAYGGLGLGYTDTHDPLPLWLITKTLARADLALARNWENHVNTVETLCVVGTDEQRARYCREVVEQGAVFSNWAAEPPRLDEKGESVPLRQTIAEPVPGGWQVNGIKRYANSARIATITCIWTLAQGAASFQDGLLMLMTRTRRPEISVDAGWWNAMGMRGSDAQMARITDLFIPDADQLGEPGAFMRTPLWTLRAVPHYAVSFLGAAEGVYDWTVEYLKSRGKGKDPFVQQRVGEMRAAVETGNAWLAQLARTWSEGDAARIRIASMTFRHIVERAALEVLNHAIRASGSTVFQREYPFERVFRDLNVYVRHENDDALIANLGALSLGVGVNTYWTPAQSTASVGLATPPAAR